MPLSKRRRLFTPKKHKSKPNIKERDSIENEVTTARGRLKGALMEMLEPMAEESDASSEYTPVKRERKVSQEKSESSSDEEEQLASRKSPQRQSYVLKLFDRSVDLSQFSEDSPLYPICRAWIANQPKANYKEFGKKNIEPTTPSDDSLELPGPEGPPISKIPDLIPEQKACSKDNINLNYREAPPPSKDQLIRWHTARWANVRSAWLQRAHEAESRYSATQAVLNKINIK
ncbi:putative antolefinin [Danaus plexippus plexippus]|uniref:Antolefinin n=1 Tax=Danaus plexippus plexippus TaxID=278856 RepID=A0A212EV51_DANPL|nr:protein lin-37 homolog isoform X2 [Danaus plexippus plexippus]OWR45380.1 putative antolefinin [Danaus plexippus plexippus]